MPRLINQTRQQPLIENLEIPRGWFGRMRGLLGRNELPTGHGLLLEPCRWVMSFGMRFTIDLIFINRAWQVVALQPRLQPNRLSPIVWNAYRTIELPAGSLQQLPVAVGEQLRLESGTENG